MKSMTKINLTLESFQQAVIDIVNRDCEPNVAESIISSIDESDTLNDLYEEGCSVGYSATSMIDEYQSFHNYSRRSLR